MLENGYTKKPRELEVEAMPCDTITTVSLNMEGINIDTMKAALEALDYSVTVFGQTLSGDFGSIDIKRGTMNMNRYGKGVDVSTVKKAYTREVVKGKAKRLGWQCREVADWQYELIKR